MFKYTFHLFCFWFVSIKKCETLACLNTAGDMNMLFTLFTSDQIISFVVFFLTSFLKASTSVRTGANGMQGCTIQGERDTEETLQESQY